MRQLRTRTLCKSPTPQQFHFFCQPVIIFHIHLHPIAMPHLSSAQWGKDNIRVFKVRRDGVTEVQTVVEMTICVLLDGGAETS